MPDESIEHPSTTNDIFNPLWDYAGSKARVKFKRSCLKQDKISFDWGEVVNIYIIYDVNERFEMVSCPTLKNCLSGAIKLINYPEFDKYKYYGYGIGLERKGFFFTWSWNW